MMAHRALGTSRGIVTARRCLCLILFAALCWTTEASAKRGFDTVVQEAIQAKNSGNLKRAVMLLRELYDIRPDPTILNNVGKLYEQLGEYEKAYETYLKVADDPDAPVELRSLDASRVAALEPKLEYAWIQPTLGPPGATLLLDGAPPKRKRRSEYGIESGRHTLEIFMPAGEATRIYAMDLPIARRTEILEDLESANPAHGKLDLGQLGFVPTAIHVDGYQVRADLKTLKTIELTAGEHIIGLTDTSQKQTTQKVNVMPGKAHALQKGASKAEATSAAAKTDAVEPTQRAAASDGTAATLTADADETSDSAGVSPWPWVASGVGLGITGAGIGLMVGLSGDVSRAEAAIEGNQVVGMSQKEYDEIQSGAAGRQLQSTICVGLGAAISVGSVVWGIIDLMSAGEAEDTATVTETAWQVTAGIDGSVQLHMSF